jgi:hypothetical protein
MSTPRTFLQLVQALRREVGAAGSGPTTVVGQTGEYDRLVHYIADADEEIQQELGTWLFMVKSFSLNTVPSQSAYSGADFLTPATDVREWRLRSIKSYLLSGGVGGQWYLDRVDYEVWDAAFNTGTPSPSAPSYWTTSATGQLLLGPAPNAVYRITGEYYRTPTTLTADADVPSYPAEFHMLPVYLAMMKYGRYTGAVEVFQDGQRLYNKLKNRMERTQKPQFNEFIPLA